MFTFFKKEDKPFDPNFQLDDYFIVIKRLLRTVAMWPLPNSDKNIIMKFLEILLGISVHITTMHMVIVLIMDTNKKMENGLQAITFHIANIVVYIMTSLVVGCFQIFSTKIMVFVDNINKSFRARSAIGLDFVTVEKCHRYIEKVAMVWTWVILSGGQHMTVVPILTWQRILPIEASYPFDVYASPYYELVFLWQTLAQTVLCLTFSNLGNFYLAISMMTCTQFDILSCSLKNLRNTALLEKGISRDELRKLEEQYFSSRPEDDEYYKVSVFKEDLSSYPNSFNQPIITESRMDKSKKRQIAECISSFNLESIARYIESPVTSNQELKTKDDFLNDIDIELNRAIKKCVEHHLQLLYLLKRFEKLFSPILLIKSIQVSLFLGMVAFTAATIIGTGDSRILNFVEYFGLSSSDMFIFCYSGQMITYMSERVRLAMLRSNWRLFGGSARRSMSIVLAASSRPVVLTGGIFYVMSLAQFRQIIQASFSYYTLMKSIQN